MEARFVITNMGAADSVVADALTHYGEFLAIKPVTQSPAQFIDAEESSLDVFLIMTDKVDKDVLRTIRSLRATSGHAWAPVLLVANTIGPIERDLCRELEYVELIMAPLDSFQIIEAIWDKRDGVERHARIAGLRSRLDQLVQAKAWGDALGVVEDLRSAGSADGVTTMMRCRILHGMNDWQTAVSVLKSIIAQDPRNLAARGLLAASLHHIGDLDAARAILEDVLKIADEHAGFLVGLGDVTFDEGDFEGAGHLYKRALKADPTNAGAAQGLVLTGVMTGEGIKFEELDYYPESIDLARVANLRAVHLSQTGRMDLAERLYRNALTFLSSSEHAYQILFNLGLCMERAERPEDALVWYRECLKMAPPGFTKVHDRVAALARKCRSNIKTE